MGGGESHLYKMRVRGKKKSTDSYGESQERIMDPEFGNGGDGEAGGGFGEGVVVTTDVTFAHENLHGRER